MKTKFLNLLCLLVILVAGASADMRAYTLQLPLDSTKPAAGAAGGGTGVAYTPFIPPYNGAARIATKFYYLPEEMGGGDKIIKSLSLWAGARSTVTGNPFFLDFYIYMRNIPDGDPTITSTGYMTGVAATTPNNLYSTDGWDCVYYTPQYNLDQPVRSDTWIDYKFGAGNTAKSFQYESGKKLEIMFVCESYVVGIVSQYYSYYVYNPNLVVTTAETYRMKGLDNSSAFFNRTIGTTTIAYPPQIKFDYEEQRLENLVLSLPSRTVIQGTNATTYNPLRWNMQTSGKPVQNLNLTELNLLLGGTTPGTKLDKLKIYYTGVGNLDVNQTPIFEISDIVIQEDQTIDVVLPQKQTLLTGNNYFWLVYDVDATQTACPGQLAAHISQITTTRSDNPTKTNIEVTQDPVGVVPIQYIPITTTAPIYQYDVCRTGNPDNITPITINATGTIINYDWTQNGTYLDGNHTNTIYVKEGDFNEENTQSYVVDMIAPPGDCISDKTLTVNLTLVNPIAYAVTHVISAPTPVGEAYFLCEKDMTDNTSDNTMIIEGVVYADDAGTLANYREIQWQYSVAEEGDNWYEISSYYMPTANSLEFEFIPKGVYANTKRLRMVAMPSTACSAVSEVNGISAPINVYVATKPEFLQNPPASVANCLGTEFYIAINYKGSTNDKTGFWYKDGKRIEVIKDGVSMGISDFEFYISNVSTNDAGEYYYQVEDVDCGSPIPHTFASTRTKLSILPKTEIVTVTNGYVRGFIGGASVLHVDATYAEPASGKDEFRWYRYNGMSKTSTKLENSTKYSGATSSYLIVNDIEESDFTYDVDYYYCVVNGLCGGKDSSEAIYLVPTEDIAITEEPENVTICNDKSPAVFSLQAFTSSGMNIKYQWYYNNEPLSDDAIFNGTATDQLSTKIDNTSNYSESFYCKLWLSTWNPNELYVNSESVHINVLDNYPITIQEQSDKAITVTQGEELSLFVTTANPETDVIAWYKDGSNTGITGSNYVVTQADTAAAGSYVAHITNGCSEKLSDIMIVHILAVDNEQPLMNINNTVINSNIELTPNPSNSILNVNYTASNSALTTIKILDLRGSTIYTIDVNSTVGTNSHPIDLLNLALPNGSYLIKVEANGKYQTNTFIFAK